MSDQPHNDEPVSATQPQAVDHTTKLSDLTVGDLTSIVRNAVAANLKPVATAGASHVNSGPPGFVNGGGHANFDPIASAASRLGNAASHVNSGPPGFVNGGGHANFDPIASAASRLGNVASHVNSGPPGFVNGGGHANFDPSAIADTNILTRVTLADGTQVVLPATGPVNMRIRGMTITR